MMHKYFVDTATTVANSPQIKRQNAEQFWGHFQRALISLKP